MTESRAEVWPPLPLAEWQDTYATLHRWSQIVGKVRQELTPPINHWWHTTYYVTSRGLTTSPIPYQDRSFQIDFDFIDHRLLICCSDGSTRTIALRPRSVADFYRTVMAELGSLGIQVAISTEPQELGDTLPYDQDEQHASYDPEYANRHWRVLHQASRVMTEFRGRFLGKSSPVHFFWGSFDLALTRFSGDTAPPHPGTPIVGDSVTQEAYSHEVSSAGFWPGSGSVDAAFYAYAYPSPEGYKQAPVLPAAAHWNDALGEFLLLYEDLRTAPDPDAALLEFLQSTYEAAADLGKWDRAALER